MSHKRRTIFRSSISFDFVKVLYSRYSTDSSVGNSFRWGLSKTSLVGGFNHLEKYEFVNGKDYPMYHET